MYVHVVNWVTGGFALKRSSGMACLDHLDHFGVTEVNKKHEKHGGVLLRREKKLNQIVRNAPIVFWNGPNDIGLRALNCVSGFSNYC